MSDQTASPPSRLRWRCRRGMQELDVMLGDWLSSCWPCASEGERQAFADLLECEDDLIWDWLTGRGEPHPDLEPVVRAIRKKTFGSGAD